MYQEQYGEDTYWYWSVGEERFSVAIDNMEVVPCCSVKHPRTTSDPRTRMILKLTPRGNLNVRPQMIALRLVIVLTRAAPALQYHFLLFFFFWVGLVVYSCVIFLLCCYGIAAQYFGFSNFGSQNTTSVQNVVLGSAWGFFFLLCGLT